MKKISCNLRLFVIYLICRKRKGGDNISTINERIKAVRKARGMTLEDFGREIGITKSTVGKIEKGLSGATEQTILSICRVFDVNEDWLRNGTGGPEAMFNAPALDDLVEQLAQQYNLDYIGREVIRTYVNMDTAARVSISRFVMQLTRNVERSEAEMLAQQATTENDPNAAKVAT